MTTCSLHNRQIPTWGTVKPLREFLLIPFGPSQATLYNRATSTVYLTRESAVRIATSHQKGTLYLNHVGGLVFGSYRIEVRSSGLWCVCINLVSTASKDIQTSKLRYYVPTVNAPAANDGKHYIESLSSVALTNLHTKDLPETLRMLGSNTPKRIDTTQTKSKEILTTKEKNAMEPKDLEGALQELLMEHFDDTEMVELLKSEIMALLQENGINSDPEAQALSRKVNAAINPDMRAYCARMQVKSIKAFASTWVKKHPGIPFKL